MKNKILLFLFLFLSFNIYPQKLLFGIIDSNEKTVVPFEYEDIMPWDYDSSLYLAKKDSKWGAIDSLGNVKIPFMYNDRPRLEKEFIIFKSDDKKYGVMDFNGEIIIKPTYDHLWAIKSNTNLLGAIKERANERINNTNGVISLIEETVAPFNYSRIISFTENYFIVSKIYYDEKGHIHSPYGLIDIKNNII